MTNEVGWHLPGWGERRSLCNVLVKIPEEG